MSMKLNCLIVGKYLRLIRDRLRRVRGANRIRFPATIDFSTTMHRCLHEACHGLYARGQYHITAYIQSTIADTSRSVAFVLFAIKSCINWRRLVYFWLFEKRFCRYIYAIVIRYNHSRIHLNMVKKHRERVTHQ